MTTHANPPRPGRPSLADCERAAARGVRRALGRLRRPGRRRSTTSTASRWIALGGRVGASGTPAGAFGNEQQLAEIRAQCRALAVTNEFAINGHENRISYIVGSGPHLPGRPPSRAASRPSELGRATSRRCSTSSSATNRWHQRQQEIVRRRDRDGEAFLRFFVDADGTHARAVRRARRRSPRRRSGPATRPPRFGIQTDPDDVETVLGYYVDGRLVDAAEIQHRKANVDANVKRGPAAVLSGAQEPPPGGKAAAEHERRGRDPVGHRPDPQARRRHRGQRRAVRRRTRPTRRVTNHGTGPDQPLPPLRARARSSTPSPAPTTSSPPRRIDASRYVAVLAGRAAGDRQPAGDARVHAHQRRQQRQLLLDDGRRGPGRARCSSGCSTR